MTLQDFTMSLKSVPTLILISCSFNNCLIIIQPPWLLEARKRFELPSWCGILLVRKSGEFELNLQIILKMLLQSFFQQPINAHSAPTERQELLQAPGIYLKLPALTVLIFVKGSRPNVYLTQQQRHWLRCTYAAGSTRFQVQIPFPAPSQLLMCTLSDNGCCWVPGS